MSKTQQLKDAGFDLSHNIPFTSEWRVRCSQCEAATINGTPCHENGCPHQKRRQRHDEDE